jgi:hypothetical protein
VTNLVLQSNAFSTTWSPIANTLASGSAISPSGALDGWLFSDTTASSTHNIFQSITWTATAYTFSIYAKYNTHRWIGARIGATGNQFFGSWDLQNGVVGSFTAGATIGMQAVGNGWYRLTLTATLTTAGSANFLLYLNNADSASALTYAGSGTGSYIYGTQIEQSSTVGEYVPTTSTINSAPRFDHNPTTGESLGLLPEEARTNSIANNTGVGVVAGIPGTLPTNWTWNTAGGASTEVLGTGTENGISYVDVRLFGTLTSAPSIQFVANTAIAAATGQTWTESVYCKIISLVSGTPDPRLRIVERSGAGSYLIEGNQVFTPGISSASLVTSRFTFTRTLTNALTGYAVPAILFNQSSGAIDITLRIGLPQLEQGAFATSVIPTTTATVTRAADVASITGSNFSSWYNQTEGTVFAEFSATTNGINNTGGNAFPFVYDINSAGAPNSEHFLIVSNGYGPGVSHGVNVSGSSQATSLFATSLGNLTVKKTAAGYQANNFGFVLNAAAVQTDTSGTVPLTPDRFCIGSQNASGNFFTGPIKRLTYWPTRLSNTTLQQITQP